MKTVISHFYNEAYLLPWWLKHHRDMFDHGIMINHGSTDESADIVREYVPHWRLVNSTLTYFNAFLNDLEVMNYEKELPGWKIALNTTEFLVTSISLDDAIRFLEQEGRQGIACDGHIIVDRGVGTKLDVNASLVKQLHWGFNDNTAFTPQQRLDMNLGTTMPSRNRFFHCLPTGMYQPGRHLSYSPYSNQRMIELMIWHFLWAPWNQKIIDRKLGMRVKLDPVDVKMGWGHQHTKSLTELEVARSHALLHAQDLSKLDVVRQALARL
jgi:hypothetical protein